MAVTFATGFEGQAAAVDNVTLTGPGTIAYRTTHPRTGACSLRVSGSVSAANTFSIATTGNYVHFGYYHATASASQERPIFGAIAAGTINVRVSTSSGTFVFNVYLNTTLIGASPALNFNQWYWIGVRQVTGTSVAFLQVDGVDAVTGTATVTATSNVFGMSDTGSANIGFAEYDDIVVDSAGFLAPSRADIALPISDNTRTAVTTGAAGTTNLWDAVNNTPPAGVASGTETATSNIVYPASTTEDYIANLETYTSLGVAGGDTVLAVQSIVRQGEDIATGTKTLQNVGALTNPTVSGASITVGGDAGAHGAEVGLWISTFGTLTTSPSVTPGTSPTIRASRVSEARVACIDFMGMLAAWTPAAPAVTAYRTAVLADNPVGYWRLGEVGGSTAVDETSLHQGLYVGAVTYGVAGALAGDSNTAVTFGATGKRVRVGDDAVDPFPFGTGTFSYECWAKRTATQGASQYLMSKNTQGEVSFDASNKISFDDGGIVMAISNVAVTDTNWHHIVVTHASGTAASTVKIYLDGVDVTSAGSAATSLAATNNSLWIGEYRPTGGNTFPGPMDEVAVYNTVLSASRVLAHYNASVGQSPALPPRRVLQAVNRASSY